MKKFISILFTLLLITGCSLNKEMSLNDLQELTEDTKAQIVTYPVLTTPLITDQVIVISNPSATWSTKRSTIGDILEVDSEYAEMYLYESTDVVTIASADDWHFGVGFLEGDNSAGWTFQTSAVSVIDSFADYSGTVAGTIKATASAAHNYTTGEIIAIVGTVAPNDYSGVYAITVVDADEFYFTSALWNASTTGTSIRGTNYTAGAEAAGKYLLVGRGTITPAANSQTYDFVLFVNATMQVKTETRVLTKLSTDTTPFPMSGVFTITDGDIINVAVKNVGGDTDITAARYANISFHRIGD